MGELVNEVMACEPATTTVLRGDPSKYLLTNLALGRCGGSLRARSRSHGNGRIHFYGCSGCHERGRSACANNTDVPMTDADSTVIEASLDDVLDEMMIRDAVDDHLDFRAVRLSMSTLDRDAQRGRISRYTSRFMITRLLFLVEGHRVDRLTFGVLAFRGGCPYFSIGR